MKRIVTLTALVCMTFPAVALRADTSDVDEQIVGGWKLAMTTPDGENREPVVLIGRQYEKYVAWYVEKNRREAFKNVELKDDVLVGTIVPQENPDITVTLEARLAGDNACEGVGKYQDEYGDSGSWNFTGKKVSDSSFDEVSTWQLTFETPDYEQHSATVSVFSKDDDLYAWYSGKHHQLPAQEISVDGDSVTMKMSAETRDGTRVDLTFRGTVEGDGVAGDAEYEMGGDSGSFPFKAKRGS